MPIYEYRCQQCGATLEVMQRMADAALKHCDACGADALERLISQTSFILKGSGWYATDYKARPSEGGGGKSEGKPGGPSEGGKSESSSGSEAPKSESPKSESPATGSKPESKSESKPSSE